MTGNSSGSVISLNRTQGPAPSTRAAWYSSGGIAFIPANSNNAANGVVFQTSINTAAWIAQAGSASQLTGSDSSPLAVRRWFNKPYSGWYSHPHIWAETTVGTAQGITITACSQRRE